MARLWTLTAILAFCEQAAPPSLSVQLQPGSYTVYTRCYFPKWELTADRQPVDLEDLSPGFTMTLENQPRFHFTERGDWLNVYRYNDVWEPLTRVPLSLQAGMAWDDSRICGVEGDEFRVSFLVDGKIQTMAFTRTHGLVSWDGIDRLTVRRMPSPIEEAAQTYGAWGRVDATLRVAPTLCDAPLPPPLRTSTSRDESTHGRKQYYLYAKNRSAYLQARDINQPDGQVVVKESRNPDTRERGPLFLMLKSRGEWTYATATPDGRTITAQGKIASCIECHESDRTRDRMFGLQSCSSSK